jgi:hypothetical protein
VNKPNDSDASVRGSFLFQRKSKNSNWEDMVGARLTSLKAGGGSKLELKSVEVTRPLPDPWRFKKRMER